VSICSRLLSGRDEPEKNELGFMYSAPPGLKQQQEKEEEEKARQQQLDNIHLGDEREKFLKSIQVRTGSMAAVHRPLPLVALRLPGEYATEFTSEC
jgi:hypothetical protein